MRFLLAVSVVSVFSVVSVASELRILTYNVAGVPVVHGRVKPRLERIAELVREGGYDVAAFQECWVRSCSDALRGAFSHAVRLREGVFGGDGLLLGSRWPARDFRRLNFALDAPDHRLLYGEADGLADKGVTAATLDTPAGPLKVFNTHLVAGYRGRDYAPERAPQLYELVRFVREYAGKDPYVLLGDLNFGPESEPYAATIALLGLRDACPGCEDTDRDGRIDHILLGPGMSAWTVRSAQVVFREPWRGAPLSDHFGFEAVLASPAPAGKGAFTLASAFGRPVGALELGPTPDRALLWVQGQLNAFIQQKASDVRLNAFIPVYGWIHSWWALRQIRRAQRLSDLLLEELAPARRKSARLPAGKRS
jgi:endonuclease/exonuclease/phosphatase family metal-dependent hydrolase